jgi:hypothetical protein
LDFDVGLPMVSLEHIQHRTKEPAEESLTILVKRSRLSEEEVREWCKEAEEFAEQTKPKAKVNKE